MAITMAGMWKQGRNSALVYATYCRHLLTLRTSFGKPFTSCNKVVWAGMKIKMTKCYLLRSRGVRWRLEFIERLSFTETNCGAKRIPAACVKIRTHECAEPVLWIEWNGACERREGRRGKSLYALAHNIYSECAPISCGLGRVDVL